MRCQALAALIGSRCRLSRRDCRLCSAASTRPCVRTKRDCRRFSDGRLRLPHRRVDRTQLRRRRSRPLKGSVTRRPGLRKSGNSRVGPHMQRSCRGGSLASSNSNPNCRRCQPLDVCNGRQTAIDEVLLTAIDNAAAPGVVANRGSRARSGAAENRQRGDRLVAVWLAWLQRVVIG